MWNCQFTLDALNLDFTLDDFSAGESVRGFFSK